MARLFGLIGNRPDLAGRVLALEAEALSVRSISGTGASAEEAQPQAPLGWGLGFYQNGEVLMRRRPLDDRLVIDLASIAADVRTDALIGHVRSATVGALRTENTHPFRCRRWLFAQTGTLPRFESTRESLLSIVPDFLRGNIRGETDAEVVFHVFLSFLHDVGKLDDVVVEPSVAREALRSTLSVVDSKGAEVRAAPGKVNMIVTNGDIMVAVHRSDNDADKMAVRIVSGKMDAEAMMGDDVRLKHRASELARTHFTLIASNAAVEFRGNWKPVPAGSLVLATRGDAPHIEAL